MRLIIRTNSAGENAAVRIAKTISYLIIGLATASALARVLSAATPYNPQTALKGFVKPARSTGIHAEIPGRVSSVLAAPGDLVQAGQVLLEMEDDEVVTITEAARIRFNRARDVLATIQRQGATSIPSEIQQERYRVALKTWEGAQKRLGDFSIADYDTALQNARNRLDRVKGQKDAGKDQIDRAERVVRRENRAMDFARERASRLRDEAELADGRLKIEKLRLKLNETGALGRARAAYEDAMLELRAANQRASRLRITAPRAATVLSVPALPGDRTYPGAPLLFVADLTSLEVEVPVSARQVSMVKAGDPVTVHLPLDPAIDLAATVSSVSPVPDPQSHAYPVRIKIGNPKPGMILAGLDCAVNFAKVADAQKSWWRRMLGI